MRCIEDGGSMVEGISPRMAKWEWSCDLLKMESENRAFSGAYSSKRKSKEVRTYYTYVATYIYMYVCIRTRM